MENLLHTARSAVRRLIVRPGLSITVILTLGICIGANSAVFSMIDAILLRPLPYPNSDRIVRVLQSRDGSPETRLGGPRLEDWNRISSAFEAIAGYAVEDASDTTGEIPERVRRARVWPRLFDIWGIPPSIGRAFSHVEHEYGGPPAVLISDRYWRTRFDADPKVLEKTVRLGDQSYPIIGVMPASFAFPESDVDLWIPEAVNNPYRQRRQTQAYLGVGRLRNGVTLEQGSLDLRAAQRQLAEIYPDTDRDLTPQLIPLKETLVGGARSSLWLVFGAVSVLLLIACTNVTALLLARASQREQEFAIRYSLGASRRAVIAQMLAEAAVLAFAGGAVGSVIAVATVRSFRALAPELPRLGEVVVDARFLVYLGASAIAVAMLCGLLPALRSARADGSLSRIGRTLVSARHPLQWALVAVQVSLSVSLLIGAGLLVRTSAALGRVDPQFEPSRVLSFHVSGSFDEVRNYDAVVGRVNNTVETLATLPGVEAAATSATLPGIGTTTEAEFELVEGRADTEHLTAELRYAGPTYFDTVGIPVVAGELCRRKATGEPRASARIEAMVNNAFVNRYFPQRVAVGLELKTQASIYSAAQIVGVVADAREIGIDRAPTPTVYYCDSVPGPFPWFLVRTRGEPLTMAGSIRRKINELEPLRAVYDLEPLAEQIDGAYAQNRLRTYLMMLFAVTALCLACLGIYGTLSYLLGLRRREVGLRLALGARSFNIVSQFVLKTLSVVVPASVAGVALSFAFTRILSGMLYGVTPTDPLTFAAVLIVVSVVASLAALTPAIRAALVEPMQVLREE